MSANPSMPLKISRVCPVCGASDERSQLFAKENIDQEKISSLSFASRKPPELMSHRLVCCNDCDLVYAPTPPSVEELASAYHSADYDSSEEAMDAAKAYLTASLPVIQKLPQLGAALEIGTGTGIFLELLAKAGFQTLVGVEPSQAAIDAAPLATQAWIQHGIFEEKNFQPESFDFICCFMTLEHVQDPMELTQAVYRLLKKGGAFVSVTHDYRSFVNKALGMRSPIIDIEHMQLFSKKSAQEMFVRAGYQDVLAASFKNSYSLQYWLRLSPLPKGLKVFSEKVFSLLGLLKIHLSVNVGNTFTVGYKK
jgi:SAM-dependent methyltransferase